MTGSSVDPTLNPDSNLHTDPCAAFHRKSFSADSGTPTLYTLLRLSVGDSTKAYAVPGRSNRTAALIRGRQRDVIRTTNVHVLFIFYDTSSQSRATRT